MSQNQADNSQSVQFFIKSQEVENYFSQRTEPSNHPEFIYFARYGCSFNGHSLALKIIRSHNFIVGENEQIKKIYKNDEQKEILNSPFFVPVENVEAALNEQLDKILLKLNYHPFSVGVTGTSGKTSIVQIAGKLLNALSHRKTIKIGTFGIEIGTTLSPNSHQTTPDYPAFVQTLQRAHQAHMTHLIMEVSSHGLAENRLGHYMFDVGVFTNFSQDHLDFHKTMDAYFEAKTRLFTNHLKDTGSAIISTASEKWIEILELSANKNRTLYLLVHDSNLQACLKAQPFVSHFKNAYFLMLSNTKSSLEGLSGTFKFLDKHQEIISTHDIHSPLIGEVNFENLMAAFCICHAAGFSPQKFSPYFAHIQRVSGRMEVLVPPTSEEPYVVIDYSHKPGALKSALTTLKNLCTGTQKVICVFGCGGDRDTSKRAEMGKISAEYADITILTSDNPRTEDPQKIIDDIRAGIPSTTTCYEEPDRKKAIEKAFQIAEKSDIILIAGKGHETYQIIGTEKKDFNDAQVAASLYKQ